MKMLTVVCRERFDPLLVGLFDELGIRGYTVMSKAGGSGQRGEAGQHGWADRNTLFLVALDETQMDTFVTALKKLHLKLVAENGGVEVALKAFVHSCEVIL